MGEKILYWVGRLIAALGGVVPRDPAEVLKVLGNLLRADPAEKARFLEDAYAAWVGGGWAVKGDPSPETRVLLMALEEGTRLVAEQHGWVRPGGAKPRIRVNQENVWQSRIRIVRQAPKPKGEGVFVVGPNGLSDKALWAAAYRVQKGQEVVLVAPPALEGVARKVAQLVARRAAQINGGSTPTVRTPHGEVRLLHGDRWEDPEALEPRLLAAWKILTAAEAEDFEEAEGEGEAREWVHQTRLNPTLIRDLLGDEAEGVETAYILEDHSLVQGALRRLDEVVGDKEFNVYAPISSPRRWDPWWKRFALLGRVPTFGEIRENWANFLEVRGNGKKKREVWRIGRMFRYLALLAAAEALITEAKDPESAVMEAVEEALAEAKRLRRKDKWDRLNPLVFLLPVIRSKVAEVRVREFGVTRISRDEARAVSRYFRLRAEGLEPEEAAEKAKLPAHLREAIEGGQGSYAVSTDYLRDYGLEPGEEPDYDTILLRAKVGELIEEVRTLWGEQGVVFVDHLLSGREIPAAQTLTPGLTPDRAEEIVAHLRRELEGWAEA
jgi:hypothetical protein